MCTVLAAWSSSWAGTLAPGPHGDDVHGVVTNGYAPVLFTVLKALTDSESGAFRLVTHLPMCTCLRPRTNDYGVLMSTGRHDSKKGRPGSPD